MKWPIFAYNKRDRLREMRTRGREGVKNPENFAYVLNGSPLTTINAYSRSTATSLIVLDSKLSVHYLLCTE